MIDKIIKIKIIADGLINLIYWLLLCIVIPKLTLAQSDFPNLTFRSITTKDGLSSNEVQSITQANDGQVWIGTSNGLNRYDGNRVTNYYQGQSNTFSLNSNLIYSLAKDNQNNIWYSDLSSISCLSLTDFKTTQYLQFKNVRNILIENNGVSFVSNEGVFEIQNKLILNQKIPFKPYKWLKDSVYQYFQKFEDNYKQTYLTSSNRIHKISSNGTEEKFYGIPNDLHVTNLYFDHSNIGWITTWGSGLYVMKAKNDRLRQILNPQHEKAITSSVTEWRSRNTEFIVVSYTFANNNGILLIDKKTFEYKFYPLSAFPNIIFVDRDNNLWIGTNKGIQIVSHLIDYITSIPIVTTKAKHPISPASVYTVHESKDHFWLTKRYSHGIFKYDKNWKLIKEFGWYKVDSIQHYKKIEDGYDFKLVGNTMYATTDLGMFLIDNTTHTRTHIYTPERAEVKLRNIITTTDSTWFIRSFDRGIFVFNPIRNKFVKKYEIRDSHNKKIINYLFQTSKKTIIASSNFGLYFYDEDVDKFVLKDHPIINDLSLFGISEDKNNTLWLCTNKGILAYDFQKNEILEDFNEHYEMGIANRVSVDSENNIWFSNAKGYWSWSQRNKQMLKFNFNSGLIAEVVDSYIHIGGDGSIYFGGSDMIYKIDPKTISFHSKMTKIVISNISVNNKSILPTFKEKTYQLKLSPGSKSIVISFSVPDYSLEHSHEYLFRFSDSDTWTNTKDGEIFIPALKHGKYQIQMKGISHFSGVETEILTLNMNIQPYWYQTLWFKILCGFCVAAMFYLFYQWRLSHEKDKSKLKADYEHKMIHLGMKNLRSQMNPHFIFNALNSINGFIVQNKTQLASDYLTKFAKLIRMILDHSKNESITLAKELEALNLYVMMEKNRFEQAFEFQINIDSRIDPDEIYVPPLILQPYVENAIWHGLIHLKKKGLVSINIYMDHGEFLLISINDNGIGRLKAKDLKTKESHKDRSYGMQITKERIQLQDPENYITIIDHINEDNEKSSGTEILIKIKV